MMSVGSSVAVEFKTTDHEQLRTQIVKGMQQNLKDPQFGMQVAKPKCFRWKWRQLTQQRFWPFAFDQSSNVKSGWACWSLTIPVAPTLAHALFVDDPAALAATSEYLERLRGQPHGVCEHFVSRLRELTATIPLSVAIVDTTDTASVQSKTTGVKKASAPTGQVVH
eukprot:COSAG06_NODE_4458_length_4242_cov_1.617186_4_plen_165_part_01